MLNPLLKFIKMDSFAITMEQERSVQKLEKQQQWQNIYIFQNTIKFNSVCRCFLNGDRMSTYARK